MDNVFKLKTENPYNLKQVSEFLGQVCMTVWTKGISYLGPKIYNILPKKLRNMENLENFKKEIKTSKPNNCPCRLCKVCIEYVGFL